MKYCIIDMESGEILQESKTEEKAYSALKEWENQYEYLYVQKMNKKQYEKYLENLWGSLA